jgi:hypothetical protein
MFSTAPITRTSASWRSDMERVAAFLAESHERLGLDQLHRSLSSQRLARDVIFTAANVISDAVASAANVE